MVDGDAIHLPPRVLVTDAEERAAVAVARGLHAAGYSVGTASSTALAPAHWSRTVSRRHRVPDVREQPLAWADELVCVAARDGYCIVIPTTDRSLEVLSRHRDLFDGRVRLGLPPHENVLRALDKTALADAAARVGLPGPAAARCVDVDEAVVAAHELGYPVIVKPTMSFVGGRDTVRHITATRAEDERELRAAASAIAGKSVVQRFEHGRVVSFAGTFAGGRLFSLAVSRFIRTWPTPLGSASFNVTIEPNAEPTERVVRLLELVGWEGIFQLQLLELPDGRLEPIDLNPRPYGSLAQAIAAGANIPVTWCEWLLGQEPQLSVAEPGRMFRWEDGEVGNVLAAVRAGRLRDAAAVMRPARGSVHSFFRRDDPGPLAARLVDIARHKLGWGRPRG